MSMILRAVPRARVAARQATQVRNAHVENTPYNCIPGGTGSKNARLGIALKLTAYSVIGFGLPFYMWKFHEKKAGNQS